MGNNKSPLSARAKDALENFIKTLEEEHPDCLKENINVSITSQIGVVVNLTKKNRLALESFNKSMGCESYNYISAMGPGTPCPACSGTGKV